MKWKSAAAIVYFLSPGHFNRAGREPGCVSIMKAQKTHMEVKKPWWNLLRETERGSGQSIQVDRKSELEILHFVKPESCLKRQTALNHYL